jgi:cation diffusion facilitator family transporter
MTVDTVEPDAFRSASARPDDGALTGAAVRRVLGLTLLLNVLVSAGKIVVGKLSGSLSMVADGYHSLTDGLNNVVGLVVASFAYKPPDAGHPYGHRKFETAATLLIGIALLGVAYHVVEQALSQVASSRRPEIGALNWVVMGVTLVANVFVAWYERREGRRLNSAFLIADSAHTRSDIYVTMGVVASFAGARAGLAWTDGLVAAGIAAFIAFLAVQILVGSFNTLTDRAVLPSEALQAVVLRVPGVRDCRDIRTRGGEGAVYVDLIVHVDGDMRLRAAHDVADRIEAALLEAHPEIVDVVVHLEPA